MFWLVVATVVIVSVMLMLLNGAFVLVINSEQDFYLALLLATIAVLVDVLLLFVLEAMWA